MYYKQDLTRSCCPYYTIRYSTCLSEPINSIIDGRIRLKASDFKAKKDQRKPINRLNQYLLGAEYKQKAAMLCPQTREQVIW